MPNPEEKTNESEYKITNNLEPIHVKRLEIADVIGMPLELQQEHYNNLIKKLPSEMIVNQAKQIVNYEENYHDGSMPIYTVFSNCSLIVKRHIKEDKTISNENFEEIKDSLDNSQDCINKDETYLDKIENLQAGNDKSFIISPVWSNSHVFSSAIYKKDDNNYEIVLINKGDRDSEKDGTVYHSFEKYIVPSQNLRNIVEIFKYENADNKTISDIYNLLEDNSINKSHEALLDIAARLQRTGNCYYKEVEEGLKYAYSRALDKFEIEEYFDGDKLEKAKIPKLPGGMQKFHEEVLTNMKDNYGDEETSKSIDELINIYDKNKEFRQKLEQEKNYEEREKIFYELFGNEKVDKSSLSDLKKCLEKVDERTLQDNTDFFTKIIKDKGVEIPMLMFYGQNENFEVDFIRVCENYFEETNRYDDINFLKEYFPQVSKKVMKKSTANYFENIMEMVHESLNANDLEYSKKLLNIALSLDVDKLNKAIAYDKLGSIREKEGYLKDAAKFYKKAYDEAKIINSNYEVTFAKNYNNVLQKLKHREMVLNEQYPKLKDSSNLHELQGLGKLLTSIGENSEALKIYKNMVKSIPKGEEKNNIDVFVKAGTLAELEGKNEEADVFYNFALSVIDENNEYMKVSILQKRADILAKMNEVDKAKKAYLKGIAIIEKELHKTSSKDIKAAKMLEEKGDILKNILNISAESLKKQAIEIIDKQIKLTYRDALKVLNSIKGINDKYRKINIENKIKENIYVNKEGIGNNYIQILKGEKELKGNSTENHRLRDTEGYTKRGSRNNLELENKLKEMLAKQFDVEVFTDLVNLLIYSSKSEEALKRVNIVLEQIKEIGKEDKNFDEDEFIDIRIAKVKCLKELGRIKEALKECQYVSYRMGQKDSTFENYIDSKITEVELLYELGENDKAIKVSKEILSNGYIEEVFDNLVNLMLDSSRSKEALELVNNILVRMDKEDSTYEHMRVNKIKCLREAGKVEEAIKECRDIKSHIAAEEKETYIGISIIEVELLNKLGKKEEQIPIYLDILDRGYEKEALVNVVKLLREKGKSDTALEVINKVLPQINDKDEYIDTNVEKFNCLRDLGRDKEALEVCTDIVKYIEKMSGKDTLYLEMSLMKANMLRDLGRDKEALEEYQKLLKMYPKNSPEYVSIMGNRKIQKNISKITKELIDKVVADVTNVLKGDEYSTKYIEKITREKIAEGDFNKLEKLLKENPTVEQIKETIGYKEKLNEINKHIDITDDIKKEKEVASKDKEAQEKSKDTPKIEQEKQKPKQREKGRDNI